MSDYILEDRINKVTVHNLDGTRVEHTRNGDESSEDFKARVWAKLDRLTTE